MDRKENNVCINCIVADICKHKSNMINITEQLHIIKKSDRYNVCVIELSCREKSKWEGIK